MSEAKTPSMFTPERVRSIGALYRNSPEGTMGHTLVAAVDELEATRAALAKLQEAADRYLKSFDVTELTEASVLEMRCAQDALRAAVDRKDT